MSPDQPTKKKRSRKQRFIIDTLVIFVIWFIACQFFCWARWSDNRWGGYDASLNSWNGQILLVINPNSGYLNYLDKKWGWRLDRKTFHKDMFSLPKYMKLIDRSTGKAWYIAMQFPLWTIAVFCATCIGLETWLKKDKSQLHSENEEFETANDES